MKIITSIKEMQQYTKEMQIANKSIGYVPTMGFLHEGHLHLVEHARKENDIVIMSIFVNPLQFGPNEDFDRYPRDFERDELLAENAGVQVIFYPSTMDMYPQELSTSVIVKDRVNVLCGKSREGHFDGVATVLTKLFNIVRPNKAYFGLKDAQQVAVVEGMVRDFNIPVEIVPVEIVREEDGLARSSRNVYLSDVERTESPALYQSLKIAKSKIFEGDRDPQAIKQAIFDYLTEHVDAKVDYVEIYSYPDLKPITLIEGKIIIAIAVKFTKARLIDNMTMLI